jgi:hypothetical protein
VRAECGRLSTCAGCCAGCSRPGSGLRLDAKQPERLREHRTVGQDAAGISATAQQTRFLNKISAKDPETRDPAGRTIDPVPWPNNQKGSWIYFSRQTTVTQRDLQSRSWPSTPKWPRAGQLSVFRFDNSPAPGRKGLRGLTEPNLTPGCS